MPKRAHATPEILSQDSRAVYDVLKGENDLAAVLISTSYLDECLAALLRSFLVQNSKTVDHVLSPNGGSLGSYASRADITYCLGLINKQMFSDLQRIAEIRNEFAHSHLMMKFASEAIANLCKKLRYLDAIDAKVNEKTGRPLNITRLFSKTLRARFVLTVIMIAQQILERSRALSPRSRDNVVI